MSGNTTLTEEQQVSFVFSTFSTHHQRVMDRARRLITLEDGHIVANEPAAGEA